MLIEMTQKTSLVFLHAWNICHKVMIFEKNQTGAALFMHCARENLPKRLCLATLASLSDTGM